MGVASSAVAAFRIGSPNYSSGDGIKQLAQLYADANIENGIVFARPIAGSDSIPRWGVTAGDLKKDSIQHPVDILGGFHLCPEGHDVSVDVIVKTMFPHGAGFTGQLLMSQIWEYISKHHSDMEILGFYDASKKPLQYNYVTDTKVPLGAVWLRLSECSFDQIRGSENYFLWQNDINGMTPASIDKVLAENTQYTTTNLQEVFRDDYVSAFPDGTLIAAVSEFRSGFGPYGIVFALEVGDFSAVHYYFNRRWTRYEFESEVTPPTNVSEWVKAAREQSYDVVDNIGWTSSGDLTMLAPTGNSMDTNVHRVLDTIDKGFVCQAMNCPSSLLCNPERKECSTRCTGLGRDPYCSFSPNGGYCFRNHCVSRTDFCMNTLECAW